MHVPPESEPTPLAMEGPRRALMIGYQGGVGNAVLALLEHTPPGRRLRNRLESLVLVDREAPLNRVPTPQGVLLPPSSLASADDLMRLVRENRITEVVDVSSIDTRDCACACDAAGTHFLCTSVEEWPGQASIPTDEAISRLLPPLRPHLENSSHLVGTGANPGIVNALVFAALQAFADRIGVGPSVVELDLYAALITEEDTTADHSQPESADVFAMTWSPQHCLEELCEPRAFVARAGRIEDLGHRPTERWYRARCGESQIEGMAVPHEEIVTLAHRFPTLEIAFLYRIPLAARRALATHSGRDPAAWSTRRLYPPFTESIDGEDRVGVLLCSRRFGELWMGFRTNVAAGLPLGTNATQLQVAAGVLAGWSQLGTRSGILFVEDLDWRAYLDTATEVLGAPIVVHDAAARPTLLGDRLSAMPSGFGAMGQHIGRMDQ